MSPIRHTTPVEGTRLKLDDGLFRDDALIFDTLASRRLTYGAGAAPRIEVDFPDMPYLGIWSKPGAGFVCIEPWQGFADPVGFDGELSQKPGTISVSPGSTAVFAISIRLTPPERPGRLEPKLIDACGEWNIDLTTRQWVLQA